MNLKPGGPVQANFSDIARGSQKSWSSKGPVMKNSEGTTHLCQRNDGSNFSHNGFQVDLATRVFAYHHRQHNINVIHQQAGENVMSLMQARHGGMVINQESNMTLKALAFFLGVHFADQFSKTGRLLEIFCTRVPATGAWATDAYSINRASLLLCAFFQSSSSLG